MYCTEHLAEKDRATRTNIYVQNELRDGLASGYSFSCTKGRERSGRGEVNMKKDTQGRKMKMNK